MLRGLDTGMGQSSTSGCGPVSDMEMMHHENYAESESYVMSSNKTIFEHLSARLTLQVLTDRTWSRGRNTLTVARAALDGGATIIQLRDKVASTRLLVEEGLALRELTRQYDALLLVNDRVDVAWAIDADGVHLGHDDMPLPLARCLLGPERILGVSAGNLAEAMIGVEGQADYISVGPIYSTQAKSDAGSAIGTQLISELVARSSIPVIAIGGITAENVAPIIRAGACGVAVITAIVGAVDIAQAARTMLTAIRDVR